MRVPMLVVALIATPLLASVSSAQARSAAGNRHSEEQQKGKHSEKKHDDKKCEKASRSTNDDQDQQGQHEDSDNERSSKKCSDTPPPPVTPPPATGGLGVISGMVFIDVDVNGLFNPAIDLPLSGWKVQLSGASSAVASTDPNGNYVMSSLAVGFYTVCAAGGRVQIAPSSGALCPTGAFGYLLEIPSFLPDANYAGIDFALK